MPTGFMTKLFAMEFDYLTISKCIGGLLMLLPLFCSLFLMVAVIAKQFDEHESRDND